MSFGTQQFIFHLILCGTVGTLVLMSVSGDLPPCLWFVDGFLIAHSHKQLCLVTRNATVRLGKCNAMDPEQQWRWTGGMKLLHQRSSQCLWTESSLAVPRHTRLAALTDCAISPAWRCYDAKGTLGLASSAMYLMKQGYRAVLSEESIHSKWTRYKGDGRGRMLETSLCPPKGKAHAV